MRIIYTENRRPERLMHIVYWNDKVVIMAKCTGRVALL